MEILILSNSVSGGGAEKSMRILNLVFNEKGFNSTLLCLNNSGKDIALDHEIILSRKWQSGLLETLTNFKEFIGVYRTKRPDVVIVNCELPELYAAMIPFKVKRLICVEHTSKPWAGRRQLGIVIRSLLFLRKVIWVTVNKKESRIWPLGSHAIHISNPVDTPQLCVSNDLQTPFVFVGRLREEKGIRMVLRAINNTNYSINIFGSGTLEEELKANFYGTANFNGFVENPWQYISADQIIIVGSEYEGDGIVVVEAILAGIPLLLRDIADLRRFELSENSYFKDQTDLEVKITQAVFNPELFRANQNTREKLFQERSFRAVFLQWEELIS
jgi:glycosyltransferase involved in cell wall biosynthesis